MRDALHMPTGNAEKHHQRMASGSSAPPPTQTYTDAEIRQFVSELDSLNGGELTAAILIGCGAKAIPPLRECLLHGKPKGIYQPRQRAVEVLAELGARNVLLEYLRQRRPIPDPVVRFGEDAVRSTAARLLARWLTDEVFATLVELAERQVLPGLVEALGEFRRVEAVPLLLSALEDDVCRSAAEEALRKIGDPACPWLIQAATQALPSAEEETPSSLRRRQSVLRVLIGFKISVSDWERLRGLLDENDPSLVVHCARIALDVAPADERSRAIRRLIEVLPEADWFLRTEARHLLLEHFALARQPIEEEVSRRTQKSKREQALDVVLRMLINLLWQAERRHDGDWKTHAE
jgi:HEAT repeat protein